MADKLLQRKLERAEAGDLPLLDLMDDDACVYLYTHVFMIYTRQDALAREFGPEISEDAMRRSIGGSTRDDAGSRPRSWLCIPGDIAGEVVAGEILCGRFGEILEIDEGSVYFFGLRNVVGLACYAVW